MVVPVLRAAGPPAGGHEALAGPAPQRGGVLYCTALYCTVLYCTVLQVVALNFGNIEYPSETVPALLEQLGDSFPDTSTGVKLNTHYKQTGKRVLFTASNGDFAKKAPTRAFSSASLG